MTTSTVDSELAFVFTDIEGSTQRWQKTPHLMGALVAANDELIIRCIQEHGGTYVKGLGDGALATFPTLASAAAALLEYQAALQEPFKVLGEEGAAPTLKVRAAIHWGAAEYRDGDYYGPALNRAARATSVGHGGQILLTQAAFRELEGFLPDEAELVDLGFHRLRDVEGVERLYQLAHPALPRDFPPLRSLRVERHNLPLRITSFIGREQALAEIHRALTEQRLLTLWGPGGAGKTRLAIEAADRLVERYPDGAWLVSLESVRDAAELPRVACEALGVPEEAHQTPEVSLANWLAERELLLVLDNCEHLTRESALLINQALRWARKLRVLTTSREPLGITGEKTIQVPPLTTQSKYAAGEVDQSPAVALFRDRARLRDPDFEVTAENAEAVFNLCNQLDGLPLGLELAAAWVDTLGVEQIQEHLQKLPTNDPLAPSRQRSLEELIAWSYSLLDEEQAAVFRQLSVFSGGWKVDAADEVCKTVGRLPLAIVHAQLARKSLIEITIQPGERGGRRQHFLSTVQDFARRRLEEAGELEGASRRHASWALRFVQGADGDLQGPKSFQRRASLNQEQANLRAALQYLCDSTAKDGTEARCLFLEIWRNWYLRGALSELRFWTERLLAIPAATADPERHRLERILGIAHWASGDYPQAKQRFERCLETARERQDPLEIATAVNNLALVVAEQGETRAAMDLFAECVEAYRKTETLGGLGRALSNLGCAARDLELFSEAVNPLEEALALFERAENAEGVVAGCQNLGLTMLSLGEAERAGALLGRALKLRIEQNDLVALPRTLDALAQRFMLEGQWETALLLTGKARSLRRELGVEPGERDLKNIGNLMEESSKSLTKSTVEAHLDRGERLTLEDCIELACRPSLC